MFKCGSSLPRLVAQTVPPQPVEHQLGHHIPVVVGHERIVPDMEEPTPLTMDRLDSGHPAEYQIS